MMSTKRIEARMKKATRRNASNQPGWISSRHGFQQSSRYTTPGPARDGASSLSPPPSPLLFRELGPSYFQIKKHAKAMQEYTQSAHSKNLQLSQYSGSVVSTAMADDWNVELVYHCHHINNTSYKFTAPVLVR